MIRRALAAGGIALLELACRSVTPSAPRATYLLDPRLELAGPFAPGIERGWDLERRGQYAEAMLEFEASEASAARIGRIQCRLGLGDPGSARRECDAAMDSGLETSPLLAVCGQAEADLDDWPAAYDLFEAAARKRPQENSLVALKSAAGPKAASAWLGRATGALDAHRWNESAEAAGHALDIEPDFADALRVAGDAAIGEKDFETAFRNFEAAWRLLPEDGEIAARTADAAFRTARYELATRVFAKLGAEDPRYLRRARESGEEFVISNWPPADREAAHASSLTRAQAATLAWRMVPAVRVAPAETAAPVASDILARRDRAILARCLQLGLLGIDSATHRARPDAAIRRPEAAKMLERLARLTGATSIAQCLDERTAASGILAAAVECGVLNAGKSRAVTGREFRAALNRLIPEETAEP